MSEKTFTPNAWLNLYPAYIGNRGVNWTLHDTKEIAEACAGHDILMKAVPVFVPKPEQAKSN
jgi:hypothetical protein